MSSMEGSTKGDWEELNKETYVCNVYVCLQNSFKVHFCTQIQTNKISYFIFAWRYLPSEKQFIILFTQFWTFTFFKQIIKKIDFTLILSAKEKSDQ